MKTTIDIADDLFARARQHADAHDTTLRALVEEGLRQVLAAQGQPVARKPFRMRTFGPADAKDGWLQPPYDQLGLHQAILDDYYTTPEPGDVAGYRVHDRD